MGSRVCNFKFHIIALVLLSFQFQLNAQASRLDQSPYPVSQRPDTLYVVDENAFTPAQKLTIATLQGILAKRKPMIYRDRGVGYNTWIQDLENKYQVTVLENFKTDFTGLITQFKDSISGYFLCTSQSASSNVAISLSGIRNAVAVTNEHVSLMESLGIPLLEDVTSRDEQWALDNYKDEFSRSIAIYQKHEKDIYLSDLATYAEAFVFYSDINSALTESAFSRLDDNAVVFGWGDDEHETVAKASEHSVMIGPADWATEIPTLMNFEVSLSQNNQIDSISSDQNVHTVCFLMSDGDNMQWGLGDFSTDQRWFGSPNKGKVKMGWTVSPSFSELAPTVLQYFYDNASDKDFFIAGPSGQAYYFPSSYPEVQSAADVLNGYMDKADLNIINVISDSPAREYMEPYLQQDAIDGIFYYDYSNYSGQNGNITFYNNKPVIGARYNLWDGFESPQSLTDKINAAPKSVLSQDGYTLVAVHAWSMSVDDINTAAELLGDSVDVVTPKEFVQKIQYYLGEDESSSSQFESSSSFLSSETVSSSSSEVDDMMSSSEDITAITNPYSISVHGNSVFVSNSLNIQKITLRKLDGQLVQTASLSISGAMDIRKDLTPGIYLVELLFRGGQLDIQPIFIPTR